MKTAQSTTSRTAKRLIAGALLCLGPLSIAWGAPTIPPPALLPLNQIPVPEPPNLFQFVKSKPAAIKLGKALFWDMQVGSDGIQSCASCHFHAGADNRLKNTVNPGTRGNDSSFQVRAPNATLQPTDFPFHERFDPDLQSSLIKRDANDIVGSQGVKFTSFVGINLGSAVDTGTSIPDSVFQDAGANMRRVTARNTPSNINAIFNFNNFWDGRAHFIFNGVNPFGPLDPSAGVYFNNGNINGPLVKQPIAIQFASLASQATGPALDDIEMSFQGRTFPELGRKMLSLTPLGKQLVHPNDSVLGPLSRAVLSNGKTIGSNGLAISYEQMIRDAFQDTFWNSSPTVLLPTLADPAGAPFTQMEANFSMFWGLAIQLYEATLVSDQTRYDRFLGGDQSTTTGLTLQQQDGFTLFFGAAGCAACHISTELTNSSVRASAFLTNSSHALIEPMPVASGLNVIYDAGFNNTSVRPTGEDIGRGGDSPFINTLNPTLLFPAGAPFPLSFSTLAELQAVGKLGFNPTLFPLGSAFTPILPAQIPANFPVANNGNFKIPGLRNVELTAPYFHNGGDMTLDDVVEFYTRGGNFPVLNQDDLDVLIADIGTLQHAPSKQAALVAFMKSMTDERVRNESAPFDHPELFIPNGDLPDGTPEMIKIPARAANGDVASTIALTIDSVASPTNLSSQTIHGTKDVGSSILVSLNNGTAAPALTVTDTTWSTPLVGLLEGLNTFAVTATDALGNATTATDNIFLDRLAPDLTINAVTTPTALSTLTLSGTVESGLKPIILVSSPVTASPVTVFGGTWTTNITGLASGVNSFTVLAFDPVGNAAIRSVSVTRSVADGNLKGTGVVDISDALRALRIAAGMVSASSLDMLHGDVAPLVNGVPTQNSAVDAADAFLILKKAVGQVSF